MTLFSLFVLSMISSSLYFFFKLFSVFSTSSAKSLHSSSFLQMDDLSTKPRDDVINFFELSEVLTYLLCICVLQGFKHVLPTVNIMLDSLDFLVKLAEFVLELVLNSAYSERIIY